jgi:hypothetical protein
VGAADGVRGGLADADVAHLARSDQLAEGTEGLLDGCVGVDAVLVVEVDDVDAQPLERAVDGLADVLRTAVVAAGAHAVVVELVAELGGQHDLVAALGQHAGEQPLVGQGAVDVGGVEEGDAQVEGAVQRGGRLGVVEGAVPGAHAHAAQALGGDGEALCSECAGVHDPILRRRRGVGGPGQRVSCTVSTPGSPEPSAQPPSAVHSQPA